MHAVGVTHGDARLPNLLEVSPEAAVVGAEGATTPAWIDLRASSLVGASREALARMDVATLARSALGLDGAQAPEALPADVAEAVGAYVAGDDGSAVVLADVVWARRQTGDDGGARGGAGGSGAM